MTQLDDITLWLNEWREGDANARNRVFATLYQELKHIASAVLRSERGQETLQPTALLNDALMKLLHANAPAVADRQHFVRIVARAMRQILVDRIRRKLAEKRGGGQEVESLDDIDPVGLGSPEELIALDDVVHLQHSTMSTQVLCDGVTGTD